MNSEHTTNKRNAGKIYKGKYFTEKQTERDNYYPRTFSGTPIVGILRRWIPPEREALKEREVENRESPLLLYF